MLFDENNFLNIINKSKAKVVAVSKTFSPQVITKAHALKAYDFGENYVQEWEDKKSELQKLSPPIRWHFIGRIQTNKLKKVFGKCELIHSVDRKELFEKAYNYCSNENITQKILLQINLSNEVSKAGFSSDEITKLLPTILKQNHLQVMGLMTMPPLQNSAEQNRPYFKELKRLLSQFHDQASDTHPLIELSMGTSHDYNVAIEEGSTIVRLGTVLFGSRQ